MCVHVLGTNRNFTVLASSNCPQYINFQFVFLCTCIHKISLLFEEMDYLRSFMLLPNGSSACFPSPLSVTPHICTCSWLIYIIYLLIFVFLRTLTFRLGHKAQWLWVCGMYRQSFSSSHFIPQDKTFATKYTCATEFRWESFIQLDLDYHWWIFIKYH